MRRGGDREWAATEWAATGGRPYSHIIHSSQLYGRSVGCPGGWLIGAQFVQLPFGGIVANVFADAVQFGFIADDVFPVIALPQSAGKRRPIVSFYTINVSFGGHGFEAVHNIRQ